jgi:hypothetical protein
MGIQQICNSVKNYFKTVRSQYPEMPGLLIVCSMIKRPGLSVMQSTANIVTDLAKLGIPTGVMPDGSPNLTVAFSYANIKEVFRAIKKDLNIQGAAQTGTINTAEGANVTGGIVKIIMR